MTRPHTLVGSPHDVGEAADTVFAFTGTLDLAPGFPLLLDRDSAAAQAWQVRGLPTTFVVDGEGRLAFRAVGGREFDNDDLVSQLLPPLPGGGGREPTKE